MSRTIPMIALRTFVEVCRFGSMKRAAEHLCVSPGAISQQIKGLEEQTGKRLFDRDAKGIQLSEAGKVLYEELRDTFEVIENAWNRVAHKAPRRTRLSIGTTATIANAWLIPRLNDFQTRYPSIEITIQIRSRLTDLKHGHVDIALQREMGTSPDNHATHLWSSWLVPVCSPALLGERKRPRTLQTCLAFPLLHSTERNHWKAWLKAHGMNDSALTGGASYGDESLLLSAACAGQGVALVNNVFAAGDLQARRLVQLMDASDELRLDYYMYCDQERREEWAISAFMQWAVQQAADQKRVTEQSRQVSKVA